MKKALYKKAERDVREFLDENKDYVYKEWLECLIDAERALKEIIPEDIRTGLPFSFLYWVGEQSGRRVCQWFFDSQWFLDSFEMETKSMRERAYHTDALFSILGIGEISFFKKGDERILRFEGGTYFAKREGNVGRNVCHYVAGFIAGATGCLVRRKFISEKGSTKREYVVEEIACVSNGSENCDFLVKIKGD